MSAAVQQALADLDAKSALHGEDIADALSVSPATLARWKRGEAMPDLAKRTAIGQLRFIVDRLALMFTPAEVRRWLNGSQPALKGERPIDLIRCGRTAEVLAAIEALELNSPPV